MTGGASFELEKSLAEGAGLRGGYSTPDTLVSEQEEVRLRAKVQCPISNSNRERGEIISRISSNEDYI